MHWEDRLRERASTQEGVVARFQLPMIGCTIEDWWHARRNGRWAVLSSRVLALRGSPASDAQRVLAACFDTSPGSFLHGPSTLAWFGLRGYGLAHLHVARPRGFTEQTSQLASVHRLRAIRAQDVMVARGVVTETPLRAIWTEAARYAAPHRRELGAERIGHLLDAAHRMGLATWSALGEMVDDIHQRGRAGTVIMRALAEARPPGSSPTESRNEERFEKLLADAGVASLERQPTVGGHEPIGRTDHRDRRLPLVIEVNSETFHTTPSDRLADELRYERLNAAGFMVGVIWEYDLWSRPAAAVGAVAEARRRARAGEKCVLHSPGCPWAGLAATHHLL